MESIDTSVFHQKTMPDSIRPMLSIVSPAYNESLNLNEFYRQVSAQLDALSVPWEIILVDDGSSDNTAEVIASLAAADSRVRGLSFARNFGHQIALSAGLAVSSGEAVIVMDSDLQHPPELIADMFRLWQEGYKIIHTVREYGQKIGWKKRTLSHLFYFFMNKVSGTKIEPGAADFKLLDRQVVDLLNQMPERTRFLRALIPWLGFRQTTIPFKCRDRYAGIPSYTTLKSLELAIDGIISFSTKPLRWISYLGGFILALTVPYGIWGLIDHFFIGTTMRGWTSLILLNLLIGGATLISLGIIGEYIGRIYDEVRHRPLYTVERTWGLKKNSASETEKEDSVKPATVYFHSEHSDAESTYPNQQQKSA